MTRSTNPLIIIIIIIFMGYGTVYFYHQLEDAGSAVSSSSGVWGGDPATRGLSDI